MLGEDDVGTGPQVLAPDHLVADPAEHAGGADDEPAPAGDEAITYDAGQREGQQQGDRVGRREDRLPQQEEQGADVDLGLAPRRSRPALLRHRVAAGHYSLDRSADTVKARSG